MGSHLLHAVRFLPMGRFAQATQATWRELTLEKPRIAVATITFSQKIHAKVTLIQMGTVRAKLRNHITKNRLFERSKNN